jgi:hypothetical protein
VLTLNRSCYIVKYVRENHPLKAILDEEGLRYVSLATRLGIHRDRFHHYLTGRRRMPSWVLEGVAGMVPHRGAEISALAEQEPVAA